MGFSKKWKFDPSRKLFCVFYRIRGLNLKLCPALWWNISVIYPRNLGTTLLMNSLQLETFIEMNDLCPTIKLSFERFAADCCCGTYTYPCWHAEFERAMASWTLLRWLDQLLP